jgi:quercetin dioxygenase-like cupin family protein
MIAVNCRDDRAMSQEIHMPYFNDLESREAKEIAPGVQIRTFWGREMLVSIADFEPNAVIPTHSHPHEQTGTVIAGALELTIGGETRWLKPGDTYIAPGGVEHGGRTGDAPTRVLDVFSPVREDYQY